VRLRLRARVALGVARRGSGVESLLIWRNRRRRQRVKTRGRPLAVGGDGMSDELALWNVEHVRFARLLDVLDEQVTEFQQGAGPVFGLMLDIVSYLREFADHVHHPREDAAFACLVRHDPALRLPINRLLQEHRAIAVAGDEFVARLNEVIVGNVLMRTTVEAAAAQYLNYYRHHLATEDREILPRAATLLGPRDWHIVAGAVASVPDPLFGDPPGESYRELREYLAARSGLS
jgi:hemerythrin-like domain-containing protein